MSLEQKWEQLLAYLRSLESVVIAFSGGVDSTLLAKAAQEALGKKALAVTARSPLYPQAEVEEAQRLAQLIGIEHLLVDSAELTIPEFVQNPPHRCYLCKMELFDELEAIARERGFKHIAYGATVDDRGDFRPGMQAARERGVVSPLEEMGLTKAEVRELSRRWGLPTWDKPSFACLASRFPYGQALTPEKLRMVDEAEQFLREQGFRQFRVRCHEHLARIEVFPEEMPRFLEEEFRLQVVNKLRELGFLYVTLDLRGFRSGSMNEALRLNLPLKHP